MKQRGHTCPNCGAWHGWYRHHVAHMQRCPKTRKALERELDAMVARGELTKTPDGRYSLPEWKQQHAAPDGATI